jgi:hypothetical protein
VHFLNWTQSATLLASIPMRASGRRCSALTLLVVVLLGGIIMPGVDAMLFHGRGAGTTFEPRSHQQR